MQMLFSRTTLVTIFSCIVSGLILGLSQPLYMPTLSVDMHQQQAWLGLLAFVGYVPLFLVIARSNLKATFIIAFLTITWQHTVVLYWIYIALHVHGHIAPVAASVITLLLPMILALMGSVFITLGRFLSLRFNISFLVIAPFALCAAEYFRNFYLFGGFPWGNVGYSIGRIDQILQVASLVGVYGLVFLVGASNAFFALAFVNRTTKNAYFYGAASILLIFGAFGYGAMRLKSGEHDFAPIMRIALLQGNISQEIKSQGRLHAKEILDVYLGLHQKAKGEGAELIIWPESAYPRMLDEEIKDLPILADYQVATVLGASVFGDNPDGKSYHAHNSALLIDYNGNVVKRYDKSHLVPFGEYVPWPMGGMVDKVVPGLGAFRPGTDFKPQQMPIALGKTISVGATVCYEGIFPEISRTYAAHGAELLINLTNDAWYGKSSAPYQHLLMYKLRSAESGLPFVRATNSGISAWVDSFGRLHKPLGLFERGLVFADVPLLKQATVYVVIGDIVPIFCLLLLIVAYIAAVLPIHSFIRLRQWGKLATILGLSAIAVSSHIYFTSERFLTDESARTKSLIIFLLCLLLMIGLLSKTKRSRSILMVSSVAIAFCSVLLAIFESPYFLLGLIFGLLIYLLAFRIKKSEKPVQ